MTISDTENYEEFRARLSLEISKTKRNIRTPWMIAVGYRPEDKDMGLRRWCEISGIPIELQCEKIEKQPELPLTTPGGSR